MLVGFTLKLTNASQIVRVSESRDEIWRALSLSIPESAARLRDIPFLSPESFPGRALVLTRSYMWDTALDNRHQTRDFNKVAILFCIANVPTTCGH